MTNVNIETDFSKFDKFGVLLKVTVFTYSDICVSNNNNIDNRFLNKNERVLSHLDSVIIDCGNSTIIVSDAVMYPDINIIKYDKLWMEGRVKLITNRLRFMDDAYDLDYTNQMTKYLNDLGQFKIGDRVIMSRTNTLGVIINIELRNDVDNINRFPIDVAAPKPKAEVLYHVKYGDYPPIPCTADQIKLSPEYLHTVNGDPFKPF